MAIRSVPFDCHRPPTVQRTSCTTHCILLRVSAHVGGVKAGGMYSYRCAVNGDRIGCSVLFCSARFSSVQFSSVQCTRRTAYSQLLPIFQATLLSINFLQLTASVSVLSTPNGFDRPARSLQIRQLTQLHTNVSAACPWQEEWTLHRGRVR